MASTCENPPRAAWATSALREVAPSGGGSGAALTSALAWGAVTASRGPLGPGAALGRRLTGDGVGTRRHLPHEGRPPVDHLAVPGLEHDEVPDPLAVILPGAVAIEQALHALRLE